MTTLPTPTKNDPAACRGAMEPARDKIADETGKNLAAAVLTSNR